MRPTRSRCLAILLGLLASPWLGAARAFAQSPSLDRAQELADAAGRAASRGNYDFAIQALREAHALTLHEGLLFSIAEAHRQRHALERKRDDLIQAIAHYKRYLQVAPAGEHHQAAQRALDALAPQLEASTSDEPPVADSGAPGARPTRLAVMSPALDASVRIDGGPPKKLPLFVEVTPGKHTIVVGAPGHVDDSREILVSKGRVYPLDVSLSPQPARLVIDAPSGAAVHVDGKRVGTTPLAKPIALEPGRHFVAVTKTGFHAHSRDVQLERGKLVKLTAALEGTRQRAISWVLIATGGAGVATGVTLGVLSVVEHRKARDLDRSADGRELDPAAQLERDAALAARDDLRVGSGVAAGTGLGLFLVGGALLVLDNPRVPSPAGAARKGDVSVLPLVGPSSGGGKMTLVF